jgi:hypothetical protein
LGLTTFWAFWRCWVWLRLEILKNSLFKLLRPFAFYSFLVTLNFSSLFWLLTSLPPQNLN